ncbi:putative chitin biosynthesis protein (Chs5) [Aspergillus foveolatus]|uniref:putative chitin biosynthesis protein (Chs5) n=1 Tax=Aspergillus foveolatus TaxID=210207 RepID=UPI003CCE0702
MLVSLTVGKVDAGVAVLLTEDNRLIEFPSVLLPQNITSGSIVDITVSRNNAAEAANAAAFQALQKRILNTYGIKTPSPPVLRLRNATQTSLVLEWDPIDLATASLKTLSLYRNGSKAGSIPRPLETRSTKISGLAIHSEYTFHLVLRTTAGTYQSEKLTCRTHKMTDLSGITVTTGVLHPQRKEALAEALDRIGGKLIDTVRIDTTHFVCTEGRGPLWEKAVEMNIPVVVPEWVDACEAEGTIVSVRGYYLNADPKARQLGPIHGSTQHQRTTSSIASPSRQSQSQSLSLPANQSERDQNTSEPPPTPFPGANMSGQPKAEDVDRVSSENSESPPLPPPKDEEPGAKESQTPAPPSESPEANGASKSEAASLPGEDAEEEDNVERPHGQHREQEQEEDEEDISSPKGSDKDKTKDNSEESDFNEVPL